MKKFHVAKPLAFSLHFVFRRDQNHYTKLNSKIMKMCEQIIKKKAPQYTKVYKKTPKCFRQDVNALRTPKVADSFRKELALKLEKLPSGSDVNCCWNGIKEALAKSAGKCIPKKKPIRNPLISPTTLELTVKRKRARTTKSKKKISREIKRQVRIDKNRFYESTADDIITADEHGNTRKVYNAVRKLTGTKDPSIDTVKDENGKFIADTNEKIKQWAKHFENLLST